MISVDRSVLAPPPELLVFHREELDRLRPIFESNQISHTQRRPGFSLRPPLHRKVRRTLYEIFDGKCAFCERPASDIAHFRPAWHATRHDGRIDPDCYWWLASDWQNLHLCCAKCSVRKTNLFPIAAAPAKPETFGAQLGSELPRLLDPCLDRPEDHLRFKSSGEVVPLTLRGEFTVHILELNNPELRYLRKRRAERVLRYCEDLWIADPDNAKDPVRFKEHALAVLGSKEYLAVTRAVVDDFLIARFDMPAAPDVPPDLPPTDLKLSKPVWLDKVEIRNFKSIDALDLAFPSLDQSAPPDWLEDIDLPETLNDRMGQPWLMVLGENGVGKSSLLQAIALALMPTLERESLASAHTWLRRQKDVKAGYVRLTFSDGSERTLSFEKKDKKFTVSGDRPAMAVLAYGSTRLLPRRTRGQLQPAPVSVRNLFDHTHPLSNAERYLCDRNALAETDFQLLAGSLKNLLPISEDTEIERKGAQLRARLAGRHVSLSELSDGYKSMLALAMDIMFHLSNSSFDMESVRGLVMIDELELHLHPRWKAVIVDQLRTLFPYVRFVATTHDPLCVLGLRTNELHVLAVDAASQSIVHDAIDVPKGTGADEILTGPWFGVASTIDAETQLLMSEHSRLLQRGTRGQGDEARRIQLEEVLSERLGSFASTRAQRAVLAAAAVLNPRVPESHLDHVLQHRLSGLLTRESSAHLAQATVRKLVRPAQPDDFCAIVEDAQSQITTRLGGKKPEPFPALWSRYKEHFSKAQLGKCGYCEGQVLGLHYGDVEHIQPKAEVHDLVDDPNGWGMEVPWASKVKGRKTKAEIARPGYWWRAYSWDNYLLSCQICNQQWKRNLYPMAGDRVMHPSTHAPGSALLLSPFDAIEPHLHFSYGRLGEISGLTPDGRATIITCGLDRPSLRLSRKGLASATHEHMDEMAAGDQTERDLIRLLRAVERDGADTQPYCGMIRTIFQQRTKLEWSKLAELIRQLKVSTTPDRPLCDC